MDRPKTIDQAQALPELTWTYFQENKPERMPLDPLGIGGDDILYFTDTDGELKEVVYFLDQLWKSDFTIPLV